jgi:pyruvate dehydrogenase E2 component (dihydrolipoamide acetyltransferase)
MRFEFKLPDLAEGMVEGEIVSWLVDVGSELKDEQPVLEVMTDKATVVISSPRAGKLTEACFAEGDVAEVGAVLFVLDVEGEEAAAEVAPEIPDVPKPRGTGGAGVSAKTKPYTGPELPDPPAPLAAAAAPATPRGSGKALATPATRRLARELGLDIGQVSGTGPGGRVERDDVRAFAQGGSSPAPAPIASPIASPAPVAPTAPVFTVRPAQGQETEERVKIRGLRRVIHETMARSTSTAAHFTYVEEIDCTQLVAARERLKPIAAAAGVRMSYLPFISKACLLALRAFPKVNAVVDDAAGEYVLKGHHHLGIAVATAAGLTVPVVRFADDLTLLELAARIVQLAEGARAGTLAPEEASGSTFTITSLGRTGGLFATPIINHPEVAILGVHKMEARAVVRDGEVVARQMMNISLSFDHRIIDGHEGAEFAQRIKGYLEDPESMMLEMS